MASKIKGLKTYAEMGMRSTFMREKGSLEASSDPEIRRMISRGRREADRDVSSMNNWANSGFLSLGGQD